MGEVERACWDYGLMFTNFIIRIDLEHKKEFKGIGLRVSRNVGEGFRDWCLGIRV